MDTIFNSQYYYFLYQGFLLSLIGKCRCRHYDPLNSNGTDILDTVHAYLRESFLNPDKNDEAFAEHQCELTNLFRTALKSFEDRWIEDTHMPLPNIDGYLSFLSLTISQKGGELE